MLKIRSNENSGTFLLSYIHFLINNSQELVFIQANDLGIQLLHAYRASCSIKLLYITIQIHL